MTCLLIITHSCILTASLESPQCLEVLPPFLSITQLDDINGLGLPPLEIDGFHQKDLELDPLVDLVFVVLEL